MRLSPPAQESKGTHRVVPPKIRHCRQWLHTQFAQALPFLQEKSVVITTDALTQNQVVARLITTLKGDYDDGTDHARYDAGRGH